MEGKETLTIYRFHWPDGVTYQGGGLDVVDALKKLGFGPEAQDTLEYFEIIEETPVDKARHDMLKRSYF